MKLADPRFIACRAPYPEARIVFFGIPFEGTVNLRTGADHGPRDLRVASASAKLTTAFAKVGLSGDYGGTYFLSHLVGTGLLRAVGWAVVIGNSSIVAGVHDQATTVRDE